MIVFVRGAIDSKYYVYVDISLSCKTFRVRRWHSCAFENDPLGLSVVCVKHAQFLSGGEAHVPSFARETHLNSDQILVICCYIGDDYCAVLSAYHTWRIIPIPVSKCVIPIYMAPWISAIWEGVLYTPSIAITRDFSWNLGILGESRRFAVCQANESRGFRPRRGVFVFFTISS